MPFILQYRINNHNKLTAIPNFYNSFLLYEYLRIFYALFEKFYEISLNLSILLYLHKHKYLNSKFSMLTKSIQIFIKIRSLINKMLGQVIREYFCKIQQVLYIYQTKKMKNQLLEARMIDSCHERINLTNQLKKILKDKKNTIFLFSVDQEVGTIIDKIAKSLLGVQFKIQKNQIVQAKQNIIKRQCLQISKDLLLEIIQNQSYRVLAINFSHIKIIKQNNIEDLVQLLFITQIIINEAQSIKLLVFAAIDGRIKKKVEEYQKMAKQFIGIDSIQYLMCTPPDDQSQEEEKYIKIIKDLNSINLQSKFKQEQAQNIDSLANFIQKKKDKENKLVDIHLRQMRKQITHCLISMVKPLEKIIQNTLNKKEEANQEVYIDLIEKIKDLISSMGLNKNKLKQFDYINKEPKLNDGSLEYKWFILRCMQLSLKFHQMIEKKIKKPIDALHKFCYQIINEISRLPIKISDSDINILSWYSQQLVQQSKIILSIQSSLQPIISSVLSKIKTPEDAQLKMAKSIVFKHIETSKSYSYYQMFEEILSVSFKDLNMETERDRKKMQEQFRVKRQNLPLIKSDATICSNLASDKQISSAMKYFFSNYFKNNQKLQIAPQVLHRILTKSAHNLRSYGFPELAVQLYKKIKFDNKVEQCVKQLAIMRKGNKNKITQIYEETSKYFFNRGLISKVFQYIQLAYEVSQDYCYMKKVVQAKYNLMNSQGSADEYKLVEGISSGKINEEDYIKDAHTFSNQFRNRIVKIDELVAEMKIETDIEIDSKDLKGKFQFIASAAPS